MKSKYTEEQKIEIVKKAIKSSNKEAVALKYGVHPSTIYTWISKMNKPQNRNETVGIKLSLDEKSKLVERCKRLGYETDVSGYVRRILFSKYIATENPQDLREELYKTRGEFNKIGSNINQIANYANYLKSRNLSDKMILEDLEKLGENLRALILEHRGYLDLTIRKIFNL